MRRNNRSVCVIGLTGGVGSGKSLVIDVLNGKCDVLTLVADDIGRTAFKKGTATYEAILRCFGDGILDGSGEIRREKVAAIIFADEAMRERQNAIIHPYVMEAVNRAIEETDKPLAVVESAILVQAGYRDVCDEIWTVVCDMETRRERLRTIRGYSDARMEAVIRNQWEDAEYIANSDEVIYNDGDAMRIWEQVDCLLRNLRSRSIRL